MTNHKKHVNHNIIKRILELRFLIRALSVIGEATPSSLATKRVTLYNASEHSELHKSNTLVQLRSWTFHNSDA